MKPEIITCNICKMDIDTSKQYVTFIHRVNKDKIQSEKDYHIGCYRDKMLGSAKGQYLMAKANQMLNKVGAMIPQ